MRFDDFKADIAAFADDENEVLVQRDGQVLFPRGGKEYAARLVEEEAGRWLVEFDGEKIPYARFLSEKLAQLRVFAERIISKRSTVPSFVDGHASLHSSLNPTDSGVAMQLLESECSTHSPFSSRVVFITADAGYGKTALLREFQAQQAIRYLDGQSNFDFWHVELQGRQLLRLSEALMGDLGDLRLAGIYMPSIVRLLHHRLLVLAVDGFDELAAEQGSTDALGALALLVGQMRDRGTIIAASRRTFFDTEDYIRRTGLLREGVSSQCEFDEIRLKPWGASECITFLAGYKENGIAFTDPAGAYGDILNAVGGDPSHPLITRPFLVSHIAKGMLIYGISAGSFVRGSSNPLEGVATVVKAFIEREVASKWKAKDTGEPYLTIQQHMELLSTVAEEMWSSQVERLPVNVIETLTAALLETWEVSVERRHQVVEMVKMHVLLTIPLDGDGRYRAFDHPEFRNYFIAYGLQELIKSAVVKNTPRHLTRFLSLAQMPDSVARYAVALVDRTTCSVEDIVALLTTLIEAEWRPTFLQANVGTLIPQILNHHESQKQLRVQAKIVYSSLAFEGSVLNNVTFAKSSFLRTSFVDVDWSAVTFEDCELTEIVLDTSSRYQNVAFKACVINGVKLVDGAEETREYSPSRIALLLAGLGIVVIDRDEQLLLQLEETSEEGAYHKLVRRVLRAFNRVTGLTTRVLEIRLRSELRMIVDDVLPLMESHGIVKKETQHGGGPAQDVWYLRMSQEEILAADGGTGPQSAVDFWRAVAEHDRT
jgi:hypothetical protein